MDCDNYDYDDVCWHDHITDDYCDDCGAWVGDTEDEDDKEI